MEWYFVRLCWKNLWRNRRRTLITVNAIAVGVTALIWIHNYYDAFHDQLVDNAIRYHSGHVVVVPPDFEPYEPPKGFIRGPGPLYQWLGSRPEVRVYSPAVLVQGLLSSPRGSANLWFKGVSAERERATTDFAANLIQGEFLPGRFDREVVIGEGLAQQLGVSVGAKVVALSQGVDGSIGNELFRVAGIFRTQSQYDRTLAFVSLNDARRLLSLPAGAIHQISVRLRSEGEIASVRGEFASRFPEGVRMLGWAEVQKNLMTIIELNRSANRILMVIILMIAAMGIANSILMSILERTREFGVMMAVGTSREDIRKMVAMETFLMGLVGVVLGNVLGAAITLYFGENGFDLGWLTDKSLVVNGAMIRTVSYPELNWANSALITTVILAMAVAVSYIPIRHISRLHPVRALRAP